MSSHPATVPTPRPAGGPGGSSAVWKVAVLLLGFAVGVLAIAAVAAVQAADQARDEVDAAAHPAGVATSPGHDHSADASANQSLPIQSFAGATGESASFRRKPEAADASPKTRTTRFLRITADLEIGTEPPHGSDY